MEYIGHIQLTIARIFLLKKNIASDVFIVLSMRRSWEFRTAMCGFENTEYYEQHSQNIHCE